MRMLTVTCKYKWKMFVSGLISFVFIMTMSFVSLKASKLMETSAISFFLGGATVMLIDLFFCWRRRW